MKPTAAIALMLVTFAFMVVLCITWPAQPYRARYDAQGNYSADQWLREHPDIAARPRAAVHATSTP